ncbi:MAG: hypothetical protein GY713_03740, partial [Actinomycetia bacterium]|nr:hypothetical protein [Actinomycetes bacterium]
MSSRDLPKYFDAAATVLAAGLLAVSLTGCDDPPIAPESSMLAISANPSTIGINGSSVITVNLIRTGGRPVDDGTEVLLSTNLGTIPAVALTDHRGVATATLQAGDQEGTAMVNASSGSATSTTQVTVARASLQVSANPSTVRPGSTSTVTIIATIGSSGQPVAAGTEILLTTTLGEVPDLVTTDGRGIAKATFDAQHTLGTARVTARLGAAAATV